MEIVVTVMVTLIGGRMNKSLSTHLQEKHVVVITKIIGPEDFGYFTFVPVRRYFRKTFAMIATITRNAEWKLKLLYAAINKHQTVINDFRQSIKDMLGSEGIVNEDDMDLTQQEFNTEMIQKSNQLADQLVFANQELKLLFDMAPTIGTLHETVQLGSVVVTDRDIFFASASIEDFELEGLKCFGLSTYSPLFKAMEGKKKGDRFAYNYSEYKIIDVC